MNHVETPSVADLSQQLANELCQLSAVLFMTYGESGEAFRMSSDEMQDFYLWGAYDKAEHLRTLAERLASRLVGG